MQGNVDAEHNMQIEHSPSKEEARKTSNPVGVSELQRSNLQLG